MRVLGAVREEKMIMAAIRGEQDVLVLACSDESADVTWSVAV